jgi:GMP synthase (glutamine-hydrolysing)
MKVLVVQNSALGTFGAFGEAIERRYRASIKTIRPDHLSFDTVGSYDADLFVLLGSRRGVYETDISWIAQEADFAKRLIRDARPLLGICFGAQIIATALGGHVSPTGRRHVGWLTNDIADKPIWGGEWFRWHRDEIDLPTGVSVLARSRATIQAFCTTSAIGIQFHPEVTEGMIEAFIEADRPSLEVAGHDVNELKRSCSERCRSARSRIDELLEEIMLRLALDDHRRI